MDKPNVEQFLSGLLSHLELLSPSDTEKKYKELVVKLSETDSIKSKISSKTSFGKKDSTKRHHHRHHQRQPGEQQFPIQVVTG